MTSLEFSLQEFAQVFREAGPYINSLRGKIIVIGINSYIMEEHDVARLMQDITLLHSLGIRLVVVFDVGKKLEQEYQLDEISVIDDEQIKFIKELVGRVRIEIESYFGVGYTNFLVPRGGINVIGANYIFAKPKGIIFGKDSQYMGEVRSINLDLMSTHLHQGNIVLISPLGYSTSGNIYYIHMSEIATKIAVAIQAEKLIFITRAKGIMNTHGILAHNLTLHEAKISVKHTEQPIDIVRIFHSIDTALSSNKVKSIQLVSGLESGSLLAEILTQNGVGTSISCTSFTNIRVANSGDIPTILKIINPLVKKGYLLTRSRSYLESHIDEFFVLKYDRTVCGCVQLKSYLGASAELACLAVLESVRGERYGEQLLVRVEEEAKMQHKTHLFALTTQAADWFRERGFDEVNADELPADRLLEYQAEKRQSKVFLKTL